MTTRFFSRAASLLGLAALALLPAAHAAPAYTLTDLGALPGNNISFGNGVNNSGQVAGESYSNIKGNLVTHAFLSDPNGGALHDLGTLGGNSSSGNGVNNSGQVTGYSNTGYPYLHAFVSDPNGGALHDLGTLSGGLDSYGRGINEAGQVTGYSDTTGGGVYHAFLSDRSSGALQDLGTLGGSRSEGRGVNDFSQAVGYSDTRGSGSPHAFLFQGSQMFDLNTWIDPSLGFTLESADSISDRGFITGYGTNSKGQQDAFLLTPFVQAVPEASSVVSFGLLLAFGLGGVVLAKKQRKA